LFKDRGESVCGGRIRIVEGKRFQYGRSHHLPNQQHPKLERESGPAADVLGNSERVGVYNGRFWRVADENKEKKTCVRGGQEG
jgi:hypothetical protein